MKGGVILFRGSGADARRYLESDRSRADEYYLEGGTALAEFTAVNACGEVIGELGLTADEYAQWVDWTNPLTGESMGKPRLPGESRRGSPRFAEMVVNVPKSLSIAATLHPEVSEALDAAQRDAETAPGYAPAFELFAFLAGCRDAADPAVAEALSHVPDRERARRIASWFGQTPAPLETETR